MAFPNLSSATVVGPAEPLTEDRDGSAFTASGDRDYTQKYRVKALYKTVSKDDVCRAVGIPAPWSKYVPFSVGLKADAASLLVDISASPQVKDDWQFWVVTCRYSTRLPASGPPKLPNSTKLGFETDGTQNKPWLERPEAEWDDETINEAFPKDLTGKPYLDTAGIPLNPPPTRPVSCPVLFVRKNLETYSPDTYGRYAYAINSDSWLGYAPKTVKCYPVKAKLAWRGSIPFWMANFKFVFLPKIITGDGRNRTWQTSVLSKGIMELKSINGQPKKAEFIYTRTGRATVPQLLSKEGAYTTTPYYIPFTDYQELPFNQLINQTEIQNLAVYP